MFDSLLYAMINSINVSIFEQMEIESGNEVKLRK